jgi:hypothetical protein
VNLEEKRIWLFGVANGCPLISPLENCPFIVIRNKPMAERWKYISELPEDQVESLISHHLKCSYDREMKKSENKNQ